MRRTLFRIITTGFSALLLFAAVNAQDSTLAAAAGDKYVISAKAGGVNFVEGSVSVARQTGRSGLLLKGDNLTVGDRVATTREGKAEILLTPGSYVRLGGDSEFSFKDTSLDGLKLDLSKGSAIFEVFAEDDYPVTVTTPKTTFSLIRSGIYRIDVDAAGNGSIEVWKGRAKIDGVEATIKGGREASADGVISKFDRDDKDSLETWSKDRSKQLAKITSKLKRDNLRGPLINSFYGRHWNMYSSFGLWVYDPFWGNYCFLPFGYGWSSPYGYGFGRSIWYYNLPPVIYNPPSGPNTRNPGNISRDQTRRANSSNSSRSERPTRPPFTAVDQNSSVRPGNTEREPSVRRPSRPIFIPRPTNPGNTQRP